MNDEAYIQLALKLGADHAIRFELKDIIFRSPDHPQMHVWLRRMGPGSDLRVGLTRTVWGGSGTFGRVDPLKWRRIFSVIYYQDYP